jgi:ABC-2 type transport system permease protein
MTILIVVLVLYGILLIFAGLVFWSPGFLFTWVFDGIIQMTRYPVGIYPQWVQLVLTWIIPVGVITSVPAQALMGNLLQYSLFVAMIICLELLSIGTIFFRTGLRRYASASS